MGSLGWGGVKANFVFEIVAGWGGLLCLAQRPRPFRAGGRRDMCAPTYDYYAFSLGRYVLFCCLLLGLSVVLVLAKS